MEYCVSLDVFEGPLDLLLTLIEREELDVTKVSLARVADQFLAYTALLQEVSPAHLADFLVIAARLLVIKSRALLPPAEQRIEEEEDPGEQLAQQLQEYKRFKEAANQLRELEALGLRSYPRLVPPPRPQRRLEPGKVPPEELLQAFKRVLAGQSATAAVDSVVAPVIVRIADFIRLIKRLVRKYRRIRFSTLVRRARSRLEIIVAFLAMLEMTKQQRLLAIQDRPFGEIYLEERQPDPDAEIPPTDLSEYGET